MYGIAIDYPLEPGRAAPDPLVRAACRAALARQAGYRRRLALMGDAWRRIVDLVLFESPEAARAALASDAWRAVAAGQPACHAAPALLVSACAYGGPVVLLRGAPGPTRGGQACWRDHLTNAEPEAVLW